MLSAIAAISSASRHSSAGPLRRADAHELDTFAHARETDVVRRDPQLRVGECALAFLDRFPPLFQWSEIPALAGAAHHPQSTFRGIEGEPSSYREVLDEFVASEIAVAKETR